MTLESAIQHLRPSARWTICGGTYAGLAWQDQAQSKPTEEEVDAAMLLPEPVAIPQEVPMWALKELCLVRGHADAIEAALNSLPDPPRTVAKNRWENKDTISRGSSIIAAMQAILGWTNAYVDELFVAADDLSKL